MPNCIIKNLSFIKFHGLIFGAKKAWEECIFFSLARLMFLGFNARHHRREHVKFNQLYFSIIDWNVWTYYPKLFLGLTVYATIMRRHLRWHHPRLRRHHRHRLIILRRPWRCRWRWRLETVTVSVTTHNRFEYSTYPRYSQKS